jgi:GDP-4-dehydro-6-deoxy-D-mannose reductase
MPRRALLGRGGRLLYANIMSKTLVTGANGFVGQHLLKELAEHGTNILAVGGPLATASQSKFINEHITLDLTKAAEAKKIDFSDVTGVIHLAGLAAFTPSFDRPMDYITTNIGIETNLFEAALAQDVRPRFLIISSGTLYDTKAPGPLTENSPVVPNSPYSVSKLGQEQMAQYYHSRGFECIIARPFNHIGPGQGLGFIVPDLTEQVMAVAQGKRKEVLVGNLDAQRDYTDVRDIARAYRLLLEKGQAGEIYNVCSGTLRSGHDILAGIIQAAHCQPVIKQDPAKMRPSDTPALPGSRQKITNDTGWQPEIPLATTLADVVANWQART